MIVYRYAMKTRHYSPLDEFILHLDKAVQTVFGKPPVIERSNPAIDCDDAELNEGERRLSASLMRVNHAGEVSAQALYQGQALTARLPDVRDRMERAALEENDHLAWCEQRCHELDSHTSFFGPVWYTGSFAIGALAGLIGDKWSLGFVAETEHQVVNHLEGHLDRLPEHDKKSRAILEQMKEDETHHATVAIESGGAALPEPVKRLMKVVSKVMTTTAYRV